jgi:hypothetical protein
MNCDLIVDYAESCEAALRSEARCLKRADFLGAALHREVAEYFALQPFGEALHS